MKVEGVCDNGSFFRLPRRQGHLWESHKNKGANLRTLISLIYGEIRKAKNKNIDELDWGPKRRWKWHRYTPAANCYNFVIFFDWTQQVRNETVTVMGLWVMPWTVGPNTQKVMGVKDLRTPSRMCGSYWLQGPKQVRKWKPSRVWEGKEAWRAWKFHRTDITSVRRGSIGDRNWRVKFYWSNSSW